MRVDKAKVNFLKKLGERIAYLREMKGLNQSQLAAECDKDRQSISRLEKGNINPSAYYLNEIATALNIQLSELVSIEDKQQ